jgi:phenylalanyl-tRNA synthetase beta chain
MIVSVNWLKKFTDLSLSVEELTELIGARLVEIEGVEDLGAKYRDVVVAKVVECKEVEDSDHLSVTKIDDGGQVAGVDRDENGLVQVVCGAPNVREGLLVAWLPPESTVPETFGDAEPFVLGARELRGYLSNGMIASAKELDLYDDHSGILELDKEAVPGTSFAELYELNDYLLDIENKSLTHRPDVFGIIGFAREAAGIQGKSFTTPAWLSDLKAHISGAKQSLPITVAIDDPELSQRYQAVVLSDINEAAQSPLQLQTYLARSGVRPISAVVDVTNYLMLLTGQPLHAFDYDKVVKVGGSADIHVRGGRKGETLKLLDGRTIKLDPSDIVIAAGETAIGLAGAMGGADTEIDDSTKNIIVEAATFNLYNLRTTQMRHGIFSEAITRFTKGQPAPLTAPVLGEAVRMMGEYAGAKVASELAEVYPGKNDALQVQLQDAVVNDVLGTQFAAEDINDLLENVGFTVENKGLIASVTAPYWRQDIHIPEDVIEEVGRLSGFDTINLTVPQRDFKAVRPDDFEALRSRVRSLLVRAGASEVLTYSFIHGDIMKRAGQNPETAYRLTNSISPDLQYYRQSLTPSLLTHIHPNAKAGYDQFALFEFNKFHTKLHDVTEEGVPKELDGLAFVIASTKKPKSAPFYQAKQYLDYVAQALGLEFSYGPLEDKPEYPVAQPFEPRRSARVWDAQTGERVGVVGEFRRSVQKAFKLPEGTAGFEIAPRALLKLLANRAPAYRPLSKYPGTERDICFQVASEVSYQTVFDAAREAVEASGLITTVAPLDIYQPESGETKNITLRVGLGSYDKTLTAEDANTVMQTVTTKVTEMTGGTVI